MLSRRELVGKLATGAAGAAVALTALSGRTNAAVAQGETGAANSSGTDLRHNEASSEVVANGVKSTEAKAVPPMELLRPLGIGSLASHGWKVAELSPVMDGTCVLTLVNERGRSHRVHICRNEGAPQGLVHTSRFDLVVMNGGQGDLPTEEGLAQAIATVAHVVAGNESSLTDSSLLAEFQSYEQRVKLFSGPADRKLL